METDPGGRGSGAGLWFYEDQARDLSLTSFYWPGSSGRRHHLGYHEGDEGCKVGPAIS